MSSSQTLTLRLPVEHAGRESCLQGQLGQIIKQRGHFRHVNEKSLQQEIGKESALPSIEKHDSQHSKGQAEDDKRDAAQALQEQLWAGRESMLADLNRAQNEILCALDFVSLLLSKQIVPAQSSMSPALKSAVPIGTVDARVLPNLQISSQVRNQLESVSQGWRTDGFRSASIKLGAAAERLQKEALRESTYWKEVSNLTEEGWMISRYPRDSRVIGVHFGFAESALQFRNRGFAPLQQDDDGRIQLRRNLESGHRKRFRVAILRNSNETGSFTMRKETGDTQSVISRQLSEGRDTIFEEELFFEICREARVIAGHGIICRSEEILFDIHSNYRIRLSFDESKPMEREEQTKDDLLAEFIGLTLLTLLSLAHKDNHFRRSQPPPALTPKPRQNPEYELIRPVAAQLMHLATVLDIEQYIQDLTGILSQAGALMTSTRDDASHHTTSRSQVIENSTPPTKSIISLSLPTTAQLQIAITTNLNAPIFGTEFRISELSHPFATLRSTSCNSSPSLFTRFLQAVALDMMAYIQANLPDSKIVKAYGGEISYQNKAGQTLKLQLKIGNSSIMLKVTTVKDEAEEDQQVWTWTREASFVGKNNGTSSRSNQTLVQVFKTLG